MKSKNINELDRRLSQMLDSRIDGEEMSDKFLLMYGRYNDENEQQHIK